MEDTNSLEFLEYKEDVIGKFEDFAKYCHPYTDSGLFACYNFCHSYGYKLKNNLLLILLYIYIMI